MKRFDKDFARVFQACFSVVLICLVFSNAGHTQYDPGIPDTVRLEMCDVYVYGPPFVDTLIIPLYEFNDEPLSCMKIPLTWMGPPVTGDSIGYSGTRSELFTQVYAWMSPTADMISFTGVIFQGYEFFPAGSGLIARLHFTLFDTGTVIIDETYLPNGDFLSFWDTSYFGLIEPQFTPLEFHIHPSQNIQGDINNSGDVEISDVVHLINYLFRGGPPPYFLPAADVNTDCHLGLSDVVYLINYLFRGGKSPRPGGLYL
jgi:hypothetical protein